MLVNAQQFPAPALWQGLMLIVMCIWMPWFLSSVGKPKQARNAHIFLAVMTILVSLLVWWVFRGKP